MTAPPTVLVTGSSRGIGRGIALELAKRGYSVAIHYARDGESARATAADSEALRTNTNQRFPVVQGELGRAADRERVVDDASRGLGGIDALVNNAGVGVRHRVDVTDATEPSWDEVLDVNLKAPHFLTQLVVRRWLARPPAGRLAGGYKLAFVGSISAEAASVDRVEYCVSKAGLAMVNRAWALRLAREGIQSLEIRPGIMATDMTARVKDKYDALLADDAVVPQARWGRPDDVALAVAAFLGGLLPFTTGDVLHVDGGFHLRRL